MHSLKKLGLAMVFAFGVSTLSYHDPVVVGKYVNPYTSDEIKTMMSYHGTLVAKLDNGQWYFQRSNEWIKIENGGALSSIR